MTAPPPPDPAPTGRDARALPAVWMRALVSVLLPLAWLVFGLTLGESLHARQALASQTSPALPELRPVPVPQPSVGGPGQVSEAPAPALRAWPRPLAVPRLHAVPGVQPRLVTLGRLNLDGG
ncbi:hypothetical protein [Deinococcus aquiradiocola]|uniref:Uncharacterized protein n=1 Tax=Deinococcus aquiradiocola TaxID=393059 RepID=A0A917P501_9DEIO|nr:hypothetical protein [Deinococcus aquiradiocola]GGJ62051.1 hypothetical protein GCM10008939_02340 [Deinococcus aquiradiocola]